MVGGGVIGLAVARQLARRGREVILLERASAPGTGTSSRNSEVVHAGIYYPPGSLKARLCVEGREQLYRFCDCHGIATRRLGKVIVATSEAQIDSLEIIAERAAANGVDDLKWLRSPQDISALEPEVTGVCALFSPSTGVVDSHGFMLALQGEAEAHGAVVVTNTTVVRGDCDSKGKWSLQTTDTTDTSSTCRGFELQCDEVVNCAGLAASEVALALGCPSGVVPRTFYAKGNYYSLVNTPPPFTHLVYPVPEAAGLGVHATVDLGGQVRFGPDVEWVDSVEDLTVDPARALKFYAEISKYWPGLPEGSLVPDYCGIRPKLQEPHSATALDFMIQGRGGAQGHGKPNLVNLLGIESPGLTSSMAIADAVVDGVLV